MCVLCALAYGSKLSLHVFSSLEPLRRFLSLCLHKLENRSHTLVGELSQGKRERLRSVCRVQWETYVKKIRQQRFHHDPLFKQLIDVFIRLGKALGLDKPMPVPGQPGAIAASSSQLDPADEFQSRYCSDKTCLCSVYKSPHRLKACKGCQQTFYCNSRCQTRYGASGPLFRYRCLT